MSVIRALPCVTLLVAFAAECAAQVTGRGTEFWGCWPRSRRSLETSAELIVLADGATDVVVEGAFSWPASTVGPGSPLVIPIPPDLRIASERTIVDGGFRVRSLDPSEPIAVLLRVPRQAEASDDIARLLPNQEIGTAYLVTSYTASVPNEPSFYAVVATEDLTTIDAAVPCAGTTDRVVLNAGEVYQVFCQWRGVPNDVTGAGVRADKPVVVLAGNSDAFVPTTFLSGDFIVETMIPVVRWGRDYYLTPHPKGPAAASLSDYARIVAAGAGTVDFDGPLTGAGVHVFASAGDFVEMRYEDVVHLRSTTVDFSVHVYQAGVESSDFGDPFMMQVPAVADYTQAYRVYTPPFYSIGTFLSVVTTLSGSAGVRVNAGAVGGWSALPGGTHAWTRVDLGFLGPEHVITGPEPLSVLVHGYNEEYLPDPSLGDVPGAYGYPAPHADPGCVVFPNVTAPSSACVGQALQLSAARSTFLGCAALEHRWLKDGALIPGCDTFTSSLTCDTVFDGDATYTLESQCAGDASCRSTLGVTVRDQPPPVVFVGPDPANICAGEVIQLVASFGFDDYAWTSTPPDSGVTPSQGPLLTLDASPDVTTTYTVVASDGRGCTSTASRVVSVTPDAVPPAVDASLRVTKEGVDARLRWLDLPVPAGRYEVTTLQCATPDSCARDPDSPTMDAGTQVALPVPPGTQTLVHVNAVAAGDLVYYQVRATSACRNSPGPTCNGWRMQLLPCP